MTRPCIRILATGGTIAGTSGSAGATGYRAGQLEIQQLLAEAAALGLDAICDATGLPETELGALLDPGRLAAGGIHGGPDGGG